MTLPILLTWSLNLGLLAGAAWVLYLFLRGRASGRWFGAALAVRLAGGVALGLLYSSPWLGRLDGGGDTLALHAHGREFTQWAATDPAGYLRLLLTAADQPHSPARHYTAFSNSFFFVRLLSGLNFLTGGNYWLNGLWLSLAAFGGSWLLARELARRVPGARLGAYAGALAWPSVVFWLSGVSKDALLLAALGSFAAAALRLIYWPETPADTAPGEPRRWPWWALLVVSGWLFWQIKFFIAAVAFVSFSALALTETFAPRIRRRWPAVRPGLLLLVLTLGLAPLSRLAHNAFRPDYLRIHIPRNQADLSRRSAHQPTLHLALRPSLVSFATHAPAAVLGVFTRPWPGEGRGLRWAAAGLENALLLLLTAWAVWGWWRRGHPFGLPPLAGALLGLVLVVAVMFGLSTPNLGTLHRYRAILLPISLFLLDWLRVGRTVRSPKEVV